MVPENPNTSLHDLLLTSWRHDSEHLTGFHYPTDPPKVLCCSDSLATLTSQPGQRSKILRLLENCEHYIQNYFPAHLVRISDMSLVTRTEFWELEKGRVEEGLEEGLERFTNPVQENDMDVDTRTGNSSHKYRRKRARVEEAPETESCIRELCKFAIFSHRWGDGEPRFQDMLEKKAPERTTIGHEKLRNFCQKASADFNCRYVWADTCCINKESSVELDEAIRSMYRWYNIATVCIVHLAQSLTVDDFGSEPWFTRGWTLQELLAPQVIRFYGKDWKPIIRERNQKGDKAIKEIWSAIERVTCIPHTDLWHFSPSCDRIAEKMTWSSRRKTAKIEDSAYCLLGLFNVSLPIAYGEADRAWYRLMAVIADECTDASFFAWAGPPSPYSRALPSSPASYLRLDPRTPLSIFRHYHPSYQVTKLGVSIKMIVTSARCNVLEDRNSRQVGYTVIPQCLETFLVGSVRSDIPHGRIQEYKLGVINFRSGCVTRSIEIGDECHCLVLAKERADDQGWIVVNTECVIVARCLREVPELPETVLLYHDILRPRQDHRLTGTFS